MSPPSSTPRRATATRRFSPRRAARLFFESDLTRSTDVFLCDLEARRLVNITRRPGVDPSPGPTADGKHLRYRERAASAFIAFDLEMGTKREVPGTEHVWTLETSADGRRIAFLVWQSEQSSLHVQSWEW